MSKVIKVENLSKAYQLGNFGTGTISRDLERFWANMRGKEDPFLKIGETNDRATKGESDVVWSLKDINFDIEQGDAVGIIGRNGAGKSTLLKILSRVTSPTTGSVKIKGRIASLLEVGTGFHPELTGRENIFLNGAILGMRKAEIKRKFDEIVDFSGVERYIDTPVKRYSSGMYVRLAFAVAAHLESEILIVDEVLAVGDAEFQKKCLGKMGDVSKSEGRTVLFVSHNMVAVMELCSKGMVLNNGNLSYTDSTNKCIQYYRKGYANETKNLWINQKNGNPQSIREVRIQLKGDQPSLTLEITFITVSNFEAPMAFAAFDIKNGMGITIMQAIPSLKPFIYFDLCENSHKVDIELNGLIPDIYTLSVWIGPHNNDTYDWQIDILSFEITASPTKGRIFPHHYLNGFIVPSSTLITGQYL
jgi:lipopolysaccharide transport system ATP-binding protein